MGVAGAGVDVLELAERGAPAGAGTERGHHLGQRGDGLVAEQGECLFAGFGQRHLAEAAEALETNRKAKYYELTPDGRHQLEAEARNWKRISVAIDLALDTA